MNIFQLFSKAHQRANYFNNNKDVYESSELMGIGLAFCNKILQKMNSELKLSSTVNVGSTFNFSLKVKSVKNEVYKNGKFNASICESIKPRDSLVSFANHDSMFQSVVHFGSKVLKSKTKNSNNLILRPTTSKLVKLSMPNRFESSNLFNKFKNLIRNKKENSISNVMHNSNNFMIERINSEFFSNASCEVNLNNISDMLASEAVYDIPSVIRNEDTSCINSIPIFINNVKEGRQINVNKDEFPKIKNTFSLAPPASKDSMKFDPLKNIKYADNINNNLSNQNYKIRVEEEKEPPNINIFSKGNNNINNSESSVSESNSNDNSKEEKDHVTLQLPNMPKRRASRIVTYNMATEGQLDFSMNNLRLKSNLINHNSASEELIRVCNIANMLKSLDKSKEENSHFSKLSSTQKQNNLMNYEISKISSMFTPICGCSSILIVDDQIINRFILNEFGLRHRVKSDEAENGKIAYQMYLKQLKKTCCVGYRLILMDLNMPVMNGIKSSQKILETETTNPKPMIVAVTGFTSDEEREKCFKVGITDVKYKPISTNTYLEILLKLENIIN